MASTLRPLTTVEILDAAWQTLRRQGAWLYAASTLGTLPLALLLVGYFQWLGTVVAGTENEVFYLGTGIWALGMAVAWTLLCVARAAVTGMAIADIRGETPDWGAAWRNAWRHAAGSAYVGLVGFAAGWGAGSCLGAGLYLTLGWWVARPVLLEEERPFGAALRRSWRLTEGHRGKSFGLWLLFMALWGIGLLNLNLLVNFGASFTTELFGIDTSGLAANFHLGNQAYTTFLCALLLVLLDPVKTVVDAVFYLDLRIRREGADLHQRLGDAMAASENGSRAPTAIGVALALLALTIPAARAIPVDSYLNRVRELRRQVESAPTANKVNPVTVADLRYQLVDLPGGQKITVRNDGLQESLNDWRAGGSRDDMLQRLQALERSLGGVGTIPSPRASPSPPNVDTRNPPGTATDTTTDPKETLKSLLQEPEFQPLAEREELRGLVKSIDLTKTKNWWDAFVKWIQKVLFKPAQPKVQGPNWQPPDLRIPIYILLGIVVLFVLALLAKWFVERPLKEENRATAVANAAKPPLTASATENALDHTVDEWEQFATQWLDQGDVRQAIRALYLATLVHLHRERRIDYNRAFTNWVYVRNFRGEVEHQGTLRRLTGMFDEVWYGDREYGEEQYRSFEQGARELGTPAPGTEPLRV